MNHSRKETKGRSKGGCITCKLRKKRCDETKPTCGDCIRLNRRCAYITDDMSNEEIQKLKGEMEMIERSSKSRKRKKANAELSTKSEAKKHSVKPSLSKKRRIPHNDKVVFNPLAMNMATLTNTPIFHELNGGVGIKKDNSATNVINALDFTDSQYPIKKLDEIYDFNDFEPSHVAHNSNNNHSNNTTNNGDNHFQLPLPPNLMKQLHSMKDSSFKFSDPSSPLITNNSNIPNDNNNNNSNNSNNNSNYNHDTTQSDIQPLSLNGEEHSENFSSLFSPSYSRALHDHFKSERFPALQSSLTPTPLNLSPIPSSLELFYPQRALEIHMNPSIVRTSTLNYLSPIGRRLYDYYRDCLSGVVCSAPKNENMYLNTFLPMAHVDLGVLYGILAWSAFHLGGESLERQGRYYIKQAHKEFVKSPLLLEENNDGLLELCDNNDDDGEDFNKIEELELASYNEENNSPNEANQSKSDNHKNSSKQLSKENQITLRLAAFEILCGVEICKGDVSKWSKYLTYGEQLIKMKGGLEKFNNSKDDHFLATNYAYHDITSVSVNNNGNLHFDLNEYEKMWKISNEMGFTDPLHGMSSPIFKILAEINKLCIASRNLTKNQSPLSSTTSTTPTAGATNTTHVSLDDMDSMEERFIDIPLKLHTQDWELEELSDINIDDLNSLIIEYQAIDNKLNQAKPKIFEAVYNRDLELQLTIFECFQMATKIHLRQSVMRMNSGCIEIQYLVNQLTNLLDVILGSDFEACLCFPMFIAGLNCIGKMDRLEMTKRFKGFIERYKWKNVVRCQVVIEKVWSLNMNGLKYVDWHSIVKKLGWELSFA